MQLLTHLHPPGGLRGRQPGDRDGQGARLLLRHLRGARHRPAHPHHRQQLHQVLQQAEEVGQDRVCRGEGVEETKETKSELGPNRGQSTVSSDKFLKGSKK